MALSLLGFQQRLLAWYEEYGRADLPWRTTSDAYAIYLSEIMLQQTQVATVLERFYFQFLERFPTLDSLAQADEQDVLQAWHGLGYYTRARNLHKAAKLSGGQLPDTVEGLVALPGIGQNTAHAIAAFAFKKPYAVMEANVKRVICRIFAMETPSTKELWEKARQLLNVMAPFDHNQAMMDLGAMICTPKNPNCGQCPANEICGGKLQPERFPQRKNKQKVPVRKRRIWMIQNSKGEIYSTPRKTNFLNGLYQFIETETDVDYFTLGKQIFHIKSGVQLANFTQQYSHFHLHAELWLLQCDKSPHSENWHHPEALKAMPVSKAEIKALSFLNDFNNTHRATKP